MKKQRFSSQIKFRHGSKKFLRNARHPRLFKGKEFIPLDLNWKQLVHQKRALPDGKSYQLNFPDNLDIFSSFEKWSEVFHLICFPTASHVILNFEKCHFVFPECVAAVAAFADHLLSKTNLKIGDKASGDVSEYLNMAGLRRFFKVSSSDKQADPKLLDGGCVPLSRENLEKTSVARKFVQLLMPETHDKFEATCECIGELMGNALDHSSVKQWYRIAQTHETRNKITIAIVDNGVGIPHTLRDGHNGHIYAKMRDSEVIEQSLDGSVTRWAPAVGEAHGAGLEKLKEVAKALDGDFFIASGKGGYGICNSTSGQTVIKKDTDYFILGTVIVLRIPTQIIKEVI